MISSFFPKQQLENEHEISATYTPDPEEGKPFNLREIPSSFFSSLIRLLVQDMI